MNRTMQAAVVRDFGRPLMIEEVPVPIPGPGEILVKVAASGVCHTDLHAADGDWPVKPTLPAEVVVNGSRRDAVADVLNQTAGGAHGVLVTAVSTAAFAQALQIVRRKGTVSLVGLPPGEFATPIFDVVLKRITIRGSIVGSRQDMSEALAFAADGRVRALVHRAALNDVNAVFDALRAGRADGRVVLQVDGTAGSHTDAVERAVSASR